MRIALVVPSRNDPAHRRVASELGEALSRRGHDVFHFPPSRKNAPTNARKRLERLLNSQRIDVCHVQFFSRGLSYLEHVNFPPATRLVLSHQGASTDFMDHPGAFQRLAERARRVTSVSAQGLEELVSRYPVISTKSCVVANGVTLGPAPDGRRAKPLKPFILCVSRLAAYKGIDILAMAFAAVAESVPELELLICGPDQTGGRLKLFLRRLGLQKRVRLLGQVSPPTIRRLLEHCRFFVLPSRRENLPLALLEAMAAGKAIVAAKAGGVSEVVKDHVQGLLFNSQDVGALTEALRRLASDGRLRTRLGRAAKVRARDFAWPVIASRYERFYRPGAR